MSNNTLRSDTDKEQIVFKNTKLDSSEIILIEYSLQAERVLKEKHPSLNARELSTINNISSLYPSLMFPYKTSNNKVYDFLTPDKKIGEIKTCLVTLRNGRISKYGQFQWDKQNDEIRRAETLKTDLFAFSIFDECIGELIFTIIVDHPDSISNINKLISEKQASKIKEFDKARKLHKRTRDNISINIKELLSILSDERDHIIINKDNTKTTITDIIKRMF